MGEIAEAIINGFYCEACGEVVDGTEPGYPRKCDGCKDDSYSPWDEDFIHG